MFARQENSFYQTSRPETSVEASSIFKYYSVKNEIDFVSRQLASGIDPKSIKKYLDNSVHRCLSEFVGKVEIDKIEYEMKDGKIYFDGVSQPVSQNYKKRGEEKGKQSREFAEAVGFEKIEEKFARDEANIAFWISPPSIGKEGFGDYGFLFVLVKDAKGHIDEYILRYQGENASLEKSWKKYRELIAFFPVIKFDEKPIDDPSVNEFLKDPLFAKTENPEKFLKDLGYKNLSEYRDFHQKLDREILFRDWLDEYIELIFQATQETGISFKEDFIDQGEKLFTAIYNLAKDINKDQFINRVNQISKLPDLNYQMAILMRQNYLQQEAVVIGGGSCPVETTTSRSFFQKGWGLILENKGILDYKSAFRLTTQEQDSSDSFSCPNCEKPIPRGKGITTCPHCGMTKEEFARIKQQPKCD